MTETHTQELPEFKTILPHRNANKTPRITPRRSLARRTGTTGYTCAEFALPKREVACHTLATIAEHTKKHQRNCSKLTGALVVVAWCLRCTLAVFR